MKLAADHYRLARLMPKGRIPAGQPVTARKPHQLPPTPPSITPDAAANGGLNRPLQWVTRYIGGTSDKDTREMVREMRKTPEFIAGMTKQANQTNFAAYGRGRHAPSNDADGQ